MNHDGKNRIAEHLAAGRWAEAAAEARAAGDPLRAREIYEKIWDFKAAAECALAAGDRPTAIRDFIDAGAFDQAREVARQCVAAGPDEARAAAEAYEARRQLGDAAALWEGIGDHARAASLYEKGGLPADAARVLEKIGRDREAGRILERYVEGGGLDAAALAKARLALGRILAKLGQHQEAARHLQGAETGAPDDPAIRAEALRLLVASLMALGLRDAAHDALLRAQAAGVEGIELEPAAPPSPGQARPSEAVVGGRYRLLRLLGAGGSGRVYLARDEVSGADVAVKLFFATQARGAAAYERFVREAKIGGLGRHPNIVEILDFRDDLGFLVMEYMSGGTLADRLRPRIPPAAARRAAVDVLAGLGHAHSRGVVHRDIKPANVFFDARGGAKLGDFGVAHLLDLGQTQTGGLIGTLAYMSPEQITGASITVAADLYAFGVTLFLALTGRLPFLGPDFVAQHLGDPSPAPSAVWPDLGAAWDPLMARLLAKDPAARPSGADEVRQAIAAIDTGDKRAFLVMPRAGTGGAAADASTSGPIPSPMPTATPTATATPTPESRASDPDTRYHGEAPLGDTPISTLFRAVDTALARTVVIERFTPGQPDPDTERRLLRLAATVDPHLQRVLAYDRATRTMTLEAPIGETLSSRTATTHLAPREVARLLGQLGRALASLHATGGAHGAIAGDRILLDETGTATLVVAGLGATPTPSPTPAADVRAALAVAAQALGSPDLPLPDALAPHLPYPPPAVPPLPTGADLARFAQSLDTALARAARARAHIASLVEHAWHLDDDARAAALGEIRTLAADHALPPATIDALVR